MLDKIPSQDNLKEAIFFLVLFSLLAGIEAGHLNNNFDSHGSILLHTSIFSIINLFSLYFAACLIYYSCKEKNTLPRISYVFGAISFLLTADMISYLGYKSLYFIKILILFIAVGCLTKYMLRTFQSYNDLLLKNKNNSDNKVNSPEH
jgi:hypothetical protein